MRAQHVPSKPPTFFKRINRKSGYTKNITRWVDDKHLRLFICLAIVTWEEIYNVRTSDEHRMQRERVPEGWFSKKAGERTVETMRPVWPKLVKYAEEKAGPTFYNKVINRIHKKGRWQYNNGDMQKLRCVGETVEHPARVFPEDWEKAMRVFQRDFRKLNVHPARP